MKARDELIALLEEVFFAGETPTDRAWEAMLRDQAGNIESIVKQMESRDPEPFKGYRVDPVSGFG